MEVLHDILPLQQDMEALCTAPFDEAGAYGSSILSCSNLLTPYYAADRLINRIVIICVNNYVSNCQLALLAIAYCISSYCDSFVILFHSLSLHLLGLPAKNASAFLLQPSCT
jgi:hypothetical protein